MYPPRQKKELLGRQVLECLRKTPDRPDSSE